ncbi:MAG: TerB family tellurite resistance protein [Pseudomonadota bacterium]
MTFWERLQAIIEETRRRTLGAALDALADHRVRRDEATFSIALIALSAKMAKADGVVTDDEIAAFQDFFSFEEEDADKVRGVYALAQKDVAGYDHYLAQVAKIFENEPVVLEDVLDCLFHIAAADGVAHPRELELLEAAAERFAVSPASLRRIKSVHLGLGEDDPYVILDVSPSIGEDALKRAYHQLVKEHHPDAMIARGVPPALVKIAEGRIAAINAAYEQIRSERAYG